ncbi:hypothetical protein AVEN_164484-1 [Araneus ventricosus]|uniref:Integrase p58-like C-terminal domain-containing protein n=1 Tax=Araneus ventricosus TaxID=182803 RepID=A0A4Y2IQ03_ARAVE|nr:hypothetical protein AVEN_164484-1 [Araneus ventricosus]
MKTCYDSGATDNHFKEGDLVWVCNPKRRRGLCLKPRQNWERPITVDKKVSDVYCRIQKSPNAKSKVIHINQLTSYPAAGRSYM